jgi:plasmid stabilization system protein ParE
MAYTLIWSPTAKFDLKDIAAFIAEGSASAAERSVRSLFQAVERLADFPESGRIVPEFNDPAIREVIRKPCRIVYSGLCPLARRVNGDVGAPAQAVLIGCPD